MAEREFSMVGTLDAAEGILRIHHWPALRRVLKHHFTDVELEITLKKLRYERSAAQNRWLWGVAYVTIAAWYKETMGESISKDAIHAHTLQHILEYVIEVENVLGKEVLVVKGKSTSKLNTLEFQEMKEKLQAYWAERGCVIPDPNQNNFLTDFIDE